jgi:acetate kinase
LSDIEAIGCRIVHGGDRFRRPAELTDEVLGQIDELKKVAPLHNNESALNVIRAARDRIDNRVPMFGVFDTALHWRITSCAWSCGCHREGAVSARIHLKSASESSRNFEWCGAILDTERNGNSIDREGPITTPESRLPIWVIPTQEGLMIAKEVVDHIRENQIRR